MTGPGWILHHRRSSTLPPLAWLARILPGEAELTYGRLVSASEHGIFEGAWVGDGGPLGPLRSMTPFGSGVLVDADGVWIVAPGHMLEGVYVHRRGDALTASNSLVGLLVAAGLELDPAVDYGGLLHRSVQGHTRTVIPTTTHPLEAVFHDNLHVDIGGRVTVRPKPREDPFVDFADYRRRLKDALASALANAPAWARDPIVTVSSGYDSPAVAVLAAELGCRRAVTVAQGKPIPGSHTTSDSGEDIARRLGYTVHAIDRLAYQRRDDLPEAEFLATGFSGEDVVLSGAEELLRDGLLVSGFFGDGMWWRLRPPRPLLWRSDQSGSTLGEWRMRVGFVHVPLPCFGSHDYRVTNAISRSAEMRPWALGGRNDKPIPRRILEDAGIPRGTFGEPKRAASATIHVDGPAAMAAASRASVEAFAAAQGRTVTFRRRRFRKWRKALMRAMRSLRLEPVARRIEHAKHQLAVLEPEFGNLLLRWAVATVRPRYAELAARPTLSPSPAASPGAVPAPRAPRPAPASAPPHPPGGAG